MSPAKGINRRIKRVRPSGIAASAIALALLLAGPVLASPSVQQSGSAPDTSPIVGRRVALVVGNSNYKNVPQLTNPSNDAQLMARTLQRLGFKLVGDRAQIDVDKAAFDKAVVTFGNELPGAAVALFFYAGHGLQIAGENYLVPVDANPQKPSDVDFQMVATKVILDPMQDAGAKLNIVILDACRNNPFGGRGLRAVGSGLAQMEAPEGTIIAYATRPGAVASDGDGRDSPYTLALAQVMPEHGVEILDTFNQVGLQVAKTTGGNQVPWTNYSPISGHFCFNPDSCTASGQPPPVTQDSDTVFWESIKDSDDPADFRNYMQQYPQGKFISLAKDRLAELQRPAPVSTPASDNRTAENPAADIAFWQSIQNSKDWHDYDAYIKTFPHGEFLKLAELRRSELKAPTPIRNSILLPNPTLSDSLNDYLHHNHLPYVNARVFSNKGGDPGSLELSGVVRTEKGKEDAALKSRTFLGRPACRVTNLIRVVPDLASAAPSNPVVVSQPRDVSTPSAAPNMACYNGCDLVRRKCLTACGTQSAGNVVQGMPSSNAGTEWQEMASQAFSNLGNNQGCSSNCEAQNNNCTQSCDLKARQ